MKKIKIDRISIIFLSLFAVASLFLYIENIELTKSYSSYKNAILFSMENESVSMEPSLELIHSLNQSIESIWISSMVKFILAATVFLILYLAYRREKNIAAKLNQYVAFIDKVAIVSKTDKNGNITYANDAFAKISKYSQNELLNQPHSIVRHPDVPKEFFAGLWERLKKGKSWSGKFKNRASDGSDYTVNAHIFPIFDAQGKITEYIAIRHDITKLEKAKEDQEKMLLHRSKLASIGEMVDLAAHQWKQPISVMKMKVDIFGYDYNDGEVDAHYVKEFQESMYKQFGHMEETLDAFRDFLRLDSKKENFSMHECCKNVLLLIKEQLLYYQIIVKIQIKEDFEVYGKENEFKHLILNILSNAKDAFIEQNRDEKIINIEVSKDQNSGILKISDNAGGIPYHVLTKIFKPHVTSKDSGTGMGMYMSHKIAKKHGGELIAQNSDKGAEFIFKVPL